MGLMTGFTEGGAGVCEVGCGVIDEKQSEDSSKKLISSSKDCKSMSDMSRACLKMSIPWLPFPPVKSDMSSGVGVGVGVDGVGVMTGVDDAELAFGVGVRAVLLPERPEINL